MLSAMSPPIRCAADGRITVTFGKHRLTVDGRLELEGLAHAYLARWLSLVEQDLVPPPPGYPDRATFSLNPARLELPVLREDAARVMDLIETLFLRKGILRPPARRRKTR
jgi:hypothetical protein